MLQVRKNRLWKLLTILFLSAGGIALILLSLNSKLDLFYTPSEMLQADIKSGYRIKLGGMVKNGSIERDGTNVRFLVTDFIKRLTAVISTMNILQPAWNVWSAFGSTRCAASGHWPATWQFSSLPTERESSSSVSATSGAWMSVMWASLS